MARVQSLIVFGSGPWAQRYMATIERAPTLALAGVVSKSLSVNKRPLIDGLEPARIWPSAEAAMETGCPIDGAVLARTPDENLTDCRSLIEAGIAVLTEKPLGLSAVAARSVTARAEMLKVPLMVNLIHLFHPGYRELKKKLADIGELQHIESKGGNWGPFRPYMSALWDYGPHDLAFALDLADALPQVVALDRLEGDASRHIVRIRLAFPGGVTAELTFGNLMKTKCRELYCKGNNGTLRLVDYPEAQLWLNDQRIFFDGPSPLSCVLQAFGDQIRQRSTRHRTAEFACHISDILEHVEESLP